MYYTNNMPKTQKQIIGDLGEGIVCNCLKNKGFKVVDRNYWKPWGELDVIVKKGERLYFVEVKTVTREIPDIELIESQVDKEQVFLPAGRQGIDKEHGLIKRFLSLFFVEKEKPKEEITKDVSRETNNDRYSPMDNIHPWKLKRLFRVIQSYLSEKFRKSGEVDWQLDVVCVYLDPESKVAKVERVENIIL